jgi:hypothetical protein
VRDLSSWLEWPAGVIRVGVVFLVAVALIAVVVRYPTILHTIDGTAADNAALSYSDREIAGGNGLVADQTAAYAARALIPEEDTYHVAVSPNFSAGSDLTVRYVDSWYRYFLMPRRPAETAPWVICYGCDLGAYGGHARVVWQGSDGISILRVRQ